MTAANAGDATTTSTGTTDLADRLIADADARLQAADADLATRYPGDSTARQPIHTVYVPADRFSATTVSDWGAEALRLLDAYAPDAETLAAAVGENPVDVAAVLPAIRATLALRPIEDLRIDFEDGYGNRPDAEEDADLARTLEIFADAEQRPSWYGIRFKCFEAPVRARGLRTLAAFVAGSVIDGALPDGFTLTLPKVTSVDQVEAMVDACATIEQSLGLDPGAIGFEIQIETAQSIMDADGRAAVARMIHASDGRATSIHYGTFDYSAGLGIAAAYQAADHPAADHAKNVMQVAAAQTGVRMSDGSTNVVAFGDAEQAAATWRLHAGLVNRALVRGIYQGWDMHPGHLVSRYLATYLFFRRAMPDASTRLRAYVDRIEGAVMDEPATARMLSHALLRGIRCGAVSLDEVQTRCGLDEAALEQLTR